MAHHHPRGPPPRSLAPLSLCLLVLSWSSSAAALELLRPSQIAPEPQAVPGMYQAPFPAPAPSPAPTPSASQTVTVSQTASVSQEGGSMFSAAQYAEALDKSLLFLEAQRSGPLPSNQRVTWRGDSGLTDGSAAGVDLVGGYYDAGDNVKFGLPMAYTTTMLSWVVLQYGRQLDQAGQLAHALDAVKWGTDYFLKAHTAPNELYVQVGEVSADHSCWMRPEDMTTPRTAYKVGGTQCGSDVAGETAAALAAASIAFRTLDPSYSATLLVHARQLHAFATQCLGKYSDIVQDVNPYYTSYSGYADELLWASVWLYKASKDPSFFAYMTSRDAQYGWSQKSVTETSWDDKFAGAQILLAQMLYTGDFPSGDANRAFLQRFPPLADSFACAQIPPFNRVQLTPGGLIYIRGVNSQYVTNAAFMLSVYADVLADAGKPGVLCGSATVGTARMLQFAKQQIDYLLGDNPLGNSFMVGFGPKFTQRPHHRGSSLPSIHEHPQLIACGEGFNLGYNNPGPNSQVLEGAIVGGPDANDGYTDDRTNYAVNEPTTYINPAATGALMRILIGLGNPLPQTPSPTPGTNPPSPVVLSPSPPRSSPRSSPPPPLLRGSPPPPVPSPPATPSSASGGYITVSCSASSSWEDQGVTTATFSCDVTNTGPYTLGSVVLDCRPLTSSNYWNIIPNGDGTCGFPSWARWGPGGGTNFGFVQQTSPAPVFAAVSYTGAPQSASPPLPSRQPSPSPPPPSPRKSPPSPPPPSPPPPRRSPSPPPPQPPAPGALVVSSFAAITIPPMAVYNLTLRNTGSKPITGATLRATNLSPVYKWGIVIAPNSPQGTLTLPPQAFPIAPGQEVTQLGYIQLASFGPGSFTVSTISS